MKLYLNSEEDPFDTTVSSARDPEFGIGIHNRN